MSARPSARRLGSPGDRRICEKGTALRTLVTGATGFLGSNVARAFRERGHDVVALVRDGSDRSRPRAAAPQFVEGDVTDRASVVAALEGMDCVVHCAAYVGWGIEAEERMLAVNVGGAEIVLGSAAGHGIPAIHVSSVAALGPTGVEPVDESHWSPDESKVCYEQTKRQAHLLARELVAEGAAVSVAIPGMVYGIGDDSELGRIIAMLQSYPVPLGCLPEARQSTVNVIDCATGIAAMAESAVGGSTGEYLLCAEVVSLHEWFDAVVGAAGRRPPTRYLSETACRRIGRVFEQFSRLWGGDLGRADEMLDMATRSLAFSGDKARAELDWRPRPLDQGMRETAAATAATRMAKRPSRAARVHIPRGG